MNGIGLGFPAMGARALRGRSLVIAVVALTAAASCKRRPPPLKLAPSGDRFVYLTREGALESASASTGESKRICKDESFGGDVADLRFSPDGRQLAFLDDAHPGGAVWVMNADCTGKRKLAAPKQDPF